MALTRRTVFGSQRIAEESRMNSRIDLALLNGAIRTPSDPPVPEEIHELNVQLVRTVPLVAA
jgi:hypothetical protein